MSATELIEKVKALPAREREAFARLFRRLQKRSVPAVRNGNGVSRPANWPEFGARLKRIYGDKVATDSQGVVWSARGDW